jgi:hypothetical protein
MTLIILHSGAQRKPRFRHQVANLQTVLFAGTPMSAFGPTAAIARGSRKLPLALRGI